MKIYKSIIIILLVTTGLFAVINQFEDSYSRIHQISSDFQTITLPEVDVNSLLSEEHAKAGIGVPIRFGFTHEVQLSSDNSGHWEEMEDGGMLWRLGLHSPGAFALKVHFNQFTLPKWGEFYVYSADYEMQLGPYTHQDNHESGTFGIPLVKGDHIVLEYYHPNKDSQLPQLHLDKIVHDYKDIHNWSERDDDRNCGDNVACSSANAYEDQVNSVIYLEMGQYICSASLVNNTAQDLKPYVLTAYHCVEGEGNIGSHNWFTFYFNHQSSSCSGSSGYYGNSETGSYIRSWGNTNSSDFALLEMDDDPSSWWDPYFAGWSRYTSSPTISTGIHHPGGAAKKINFDNDQAYGCSWYGSNTHWCLTWDDGGTAGGSSGSPVFNSDKRIVGQLTGGTGADCGNGTDYYGKFSKSWSNSNSSSGNLKAWLDPGNTGVYTLDGTYDGNSVVWGCTDSNACNYNPEATDNDGSCTYPQGTCDCNGNPTGNYCNCNGAVYDSCGVCGGNGSSCEAEVILSFGNSNGNTGSVELFMENSEPVDGFQFVIYDVPDYLNLVEVSGGSSENYGFMVSSSETGTIIGFSMTTSYIPAGSGVLLNAVFENTSTGNDTYELCLGDAIFSDLVGEALNVELGGCGTLMFVDGVAGDLNDDGLVNVLDVVIMVNIVLGIEENQPAADLNGDGLTNVLDVVILVNWILVGGG
jgi:hypothetical protein